MRKWKGKLKKISHKNKQKIKLNNKLIKIDPKIVELVSILNKFGIKTLHSCQGDKRGYISIHPNNYELWLSKGKPTLNLRFPTPKKVKIK